MKKHDWLFKNPAVDLHRKFRRIFEASLVITLILLIIVFFSFKNLRSRINFKRRKPHPPHTPVFRLRLRTMIFRKN
jgi:hypothetical protein